MNLMLQNLTKNGFIQHKPNQIKRKHPKMFCVEHNTITTTYLLFKKRTQSQLKVN